MRIRGNAVVQGRHEPTEALVGEPSCERCRALCCRGFATVTLRPEEYAEDALLVEAGFAESRGPVWVLPRVERRCAYLDDQSNRCLIHDDRPRACRDYDCRHEWAARTLLSLLEAQGEGVVGTPPWETVRGP